MSNFKLIYLISHGHTARGAFQTGVLSMLCKSGIDVTVLAKRDPEGELERRVAETGAKFETYSPPVLNKFNQLTIFRSYVHQNIRKNPALWEKHQRRSMDKSASTKRKLMNKLYLLGGDLIRTIPFAKSIYKNFEKKLYQDENLDRILKRINPDAIVSTRPVDLLEIFALNAAEKLGIKKVMYILSWDNITAKGIFPVTADYYLTWGPIMNTELKEYYNAPDSNVHLTGVTHFDVHHHVKNNPTNDKWMKHLELDPDKPYLFFTMSASYYAPNEIDIIEWMAKKVEENAYGKDMQLILRPHMHNFQEGFSDLSWTNRLMGLKSNRVAIDLPDLDNSLLTWYTKQDDMLKLSNLINGSTICFNSGSTIAIEASILDKPTIITMFDTDNWPEWNSVKRIEKYIHLDKYFKLGAANVVYSFDELDQWILTYVESPEYTIEKRKLAAEKECFKIDGKASERFVTNILKVLND